MNQTFVPDGRTRITVAVPAPYLLPIGINGLIKFLRTVKMV